MALANKPRRTNMVVDSSRVSATFRCENCGMKLTIRLSKLLYKVQEKELITCYCTGKLNPIHIVIDPYEIKEAMKRMEKKKETYEIFLRKGKS